MPLRPKVASVLLLKRFPTRLLSSLSLLAVSALLSLAQASQPFQLSPAEVKIVQAHGPWPTSVPADPGNALSGLAWAENLGESLFFDKTLSDQNRFSCASCHSPDLGFSDAMSVARGASLGVRNSQGLLDAGLQRWFGWDGGADSLWAAAMRPMLASHEMAGTIEGLANALRDNELFVSTINTHLNMPNPAVKNSSASVVNKDLISSMTDEDMVVLAAKSIGAYVRTLQSVRTPFDRFRDALVTGDSAGQSEYSESAKRGLKLFIGEANCRACHFGENFSNGEFHDTGRPFFTGVGRVDPGRYTGIQRVRSDPYNLLGEFAEGPGQNDKLKTSNVKLSQSNWGQWRTPSLRNLKHTAPYMHDGSLRTLRDVVDAYADFDPSRLHAAGESLLKPLALNEQQRNDLVAFLLSLSAED